MKKLIVFLLVLVIAVSCATAKEGSLSYGPKFALNFSTEGGDNSSYIQSSTKFGIGGFVLYDLTAPFSLQGELLYNRKGCNTTAYNPTVTITGSYLELVALAKYNIQVEGTIKPAVFAGPSFGILLSANAAQGGTTTDISSDVSGSDFGLVIGAGGSYTLQKGSVMVDLRYYFGLSNVNKNSPPSNTNQVFSINIGYAFM